MPFILGIAGVRFAISRFCPTESQLATDYTDFTRPRKIGAMALTATVYNLKIHLSDSDRNVYESLDLRVAQQPSETPENMLMRVLAYCLEYRDGIVFTEGIAAGDEPAVLVRDLTGRITAWIEVGLPDAQRLHRGMKMAGAAAVYTHRDARKLVAQLSAEKIHRASEIPIHAIEKSFIEELGSLIERRSELSMSVFDREISLNIRDRNLTTTVVAHRLASEK
jgi:uncharacterized protein YaeQ